MRYQFLLSGGAQEDMAGCRQEDRYAATKLALVLRELRDGRILSEELIEVGAGQAPIEDVEQVFSLQEKRINAYRCKITEVSAWRIITVADHPKKRVGVFAVMRRDQDYEKDGELWARIERECDEYGFERY